MSLKDRLKTERERAKLTQHDLAQKVGIDKTQSPIANLEAGTYESSNYLPEIAYALGLHAMWLKTGIGRKYLDEPPGAFVTKDAAEVSYLPAPPAYLNELVTIAQRLNDKGLQRLIGMATVIAEQYPAPPQRR